MLQSCILKITVFKKTQQLKKPQMFSPSYFTEGFLSLSLPFPFHFSSTLRCGVMPRWLRGRPG